MTTWYDPDEIKAQADGAQTQPEFDPPPTPGYDDVETNATEAVADAVARVNEIAAIVDSEITNHPPAVQ